MVNENNVQLVMPRMGVAVKALIGISVLVFLGELIIEKSLEIPVAYWLGFVPKLVMHGWLWQLFTYAFLHAGVFHLLFNLLVVWSIGSELEHLWGAKFFLFYFFSCTIGAAITYLLFSLLGIGGAMDMPVVGSSGAVYGILLAYGILFGDRLLYFFMIFPMRAKYFVMILGGIVLISTVFYSKDGIAHTAHLGGMVAGFLVLMLVTIWKRQQRLGVGSKRSVSGRAKSQASKQKSQHLRLVKNSNDDENDGSPKIWH